jgi:hypothetical protein
MEAIHRLTEDSVVTSRYTLRQRDILFVLFASGLMGLFLGLATGWQVAVESAQVVAGIVQYPRDNPFAMYHLKTWTLLHQIPAALLVCGVPERIVAMGIAGLTGMVSFTALALCAYACGATRLLASMTPVLLLGTQVYGELSSIYPIRVLSNAPWVLYGCFGTSLVLLIWSLIGIGARRTGAFLMGLAPAVHPTMGAWCLGIGGLAWLWNWRSARESWRSTAGYVAAGLMLTTLSLSIHLYLSREVPDIAAADKASYIAAFAANWDSHRRPFPMDHLVSLAAASAAILCGLWLRLFRDRLPQASQFLLSALFLSAAISLGLCASTQWQEHLPTVLLMAMPGRFINVVGLAFPALCLGLLYRNRPTLLGHLMLAGFLLYLMLAVQRLELGRIYVPMPGLIFLACVFSLLSQARWFTTTVPAPRLWRSLHVLGPLMLAALATMVGLEDPQIGAFLWFMLACTLVLRLYPVSKAAEWGHPLLDAVNAFSLWAGAAMMLGVPFTISLWMSLSAWWLLQRPELMERIIEHFHLAQARRALAVSLCIASTLGIGLFLGLQAKTGYLEMADWQNHPVYARCFRGSGMLLTASTIRATQLRTRRPVLLEGPALNQLPYVPESGPSMNHILQRVYGVDLFQPRSAECARGGGLERESGRDLWESRELEQWQALAREFGFTQIVTFAHWELKLPLVARTEKMLLYDVPLPDDPLAVTLRATSPTH